MQKIDAHPVGWMPPGPHALRAFGGGAGRGRHLNQKLTAWWELAFPDFRAEVKKALKRDIPLKERDDWQGWLDDGRQQHQALTGQIVRLETELNERVYALFRLTPAEIKIIEDSTRYRYGEV